MVNSKIKFQLQKNLPVISSMGYYIYDPIWAQQFHSTPNASELQYVIHGSVKVQTQSWAYTAKPGDVIYIPINTRHRDEFNISSGFEVFIVFFKWDIEQEYLKLISLKHIQSLSTFSRVEINRLFEHMRTGFSRNSEVDQLITGSYILTILLVIMRDMMEKRIVSKYGCHSQTSTQHRDWIMLQAKRFLENHYHEPIMLDDISHAIGISTFYLSHVFSETSDFSLFSYLMKLRMNKAKELLTEGHLNVTETARAVGYTDSNYFSKVFHKYFGVSPKKIHGFFR